MGSQGEGPISCPFVRPNCAYASGKSANCSVAKCRTPSRPARIIQKAKENILAAAAEASASDELM